MSNPKCPECHAPTVQEKRTADQMFNVCQGPKLFDDEDVRRAERDAKKAAAYGLANTQELDDAWRTGLNQSTCGKAFRVGPEPYEDPRNAAKYGDWK